MPHGIAGVRAARALGWRVQPVPDATAAATAATAATAVSSPGGTGGPTARTCRHADIRRWGCRYGSAPWRRSDLWHDDAPGDVACAPRFGGVGGSAPYGCQGTRGRQPVGPSDLTGRFAAHLARFIRRLWLQGAIGGADSSLHPCRPAFHAVIWPRRGAFRGPDATAARAYAPG